MLAELPAEEQAKVVATGDSTLITRASSAIKNARMKKQREAKTQELNELAANSSTMNGLGLHSVIYVDPPWEYLGKPKS